MKKTNIRILWNEDENNNITDFRIVEFSRDVDPSEWPRYLYKTYCNDIGNCLSEWDEWQLVDLLFNFGFQNRFVTHELCINFLKELSKVEEFENQINGYLSYLDPLYL